MSSSCSYIVACISFNLQRERNALNKVPLEKNASSFYYQLIIWTNVFRGATFPKMLPPSSRNVNDNSVHIYREYADLDENTYGTR